ncbi:MAG: valine--tRNA ligase [Chlamydiales bacterium]
MKQQLPKAYDSKLTEPKWSLFWEEHDLFSPNMESEGTPYCIVMPPPNVTGSLHMGHALVTTLQDILIRWKRMCGLKVLWVPGTDHAGIATQTIVEKHLLKTTGKKRIDFDRETFLDHVWNWKENNEQTIINQLKRLGASCDWSRKCFTMDPKANRAVKKFFKTLFDQGLVYRGDYLVNWDPVTQTALADDEVEYEEKNSYLWYFRYPLENSGETVTIATTRPETLLGDTAIAVSPSDKRYQHLIGKYVILPLTNRKIPIIADHRVDPEFGTGALKITPAHDPNDYQIGLEHKLPFINMMTPDGRINEVGGILAGLTMQDGRNAIVKAMHEKGLVEKIQPHIHRVGVSYRSKATIEPYMSKQWFVRMEGFAEKLRALINEGEVTLIPESWKNVYFHWVNHLRDWCISRQLWWGHRIPIWYHKEDPEKMICYDGEEEPEEVKQEPHMWEQDPDVLDTWFSSGLWPMTVLGWPEETEDLKEFYPNSVLVTAHDILFFWVARMLFMDQHALSTPPFPEVFLHGLIYGKSYWRQTGDGSITYITGQEREEYDSGAPLPKDVSFRWEKMSKTKGNIIDPLEIIEVYGTDAMRMGLCSTPTQQREIDLDRRRFEEFKNFANKLWNGARFVLMHLEDLDAEEFGRGLDFDLLDLEDRWILGALRQVIHKVNAYLEDYIFDQASLSAYDFFWKEFCAYYVEIVKPVLSGRTGSPEKRKNKQKILSIVLSNAIRLLHPMAPFVTEELFHILKSYLAGSTVQSTQDHYTREVIQSLEAFSCIVSPYPKLQQELSTEVDVSEDFDKVIQALYQIRNIRGEMGIAPAVETEVIIVASEHSHTLKMLEQYQHILLALVKIKSLRFLHNEPKHDFASSGILDDVMIYIPLPKDLLEKEKLRLEKEQMKLQNTITTLKERLKNPQFIEKAPPDLVAKQKDVLEKMFLDLQAVESKLHKISQ